MTDTNNLNNEIEVQVGEFESKLAEKVSTKDASLDDDTVFDEDAELGDNQIVKKLREKLKKAVDEKQEYLTNWQKDKAEFINARRRDEESKQEFLKFAKQGVIEDILPVLDSFDMALSTMNSTSESVSPEWKKGVEGIYNQLKSILAKNEVISFGETGDMFDPNLHQSIGVVDTDDTSKEDTISEVLQKGYKIAGRVIRPAFVKVYQSK
jgi:molecular chaperone GrpE